MQDEQNIGIIIENCRSTIGCLEKMAAITFQDDRLTQINALISIERDMMRMVQHLPENKPCRFRPVVSCGENTKIGVKE